MASNPKVPLDVTLLARARAMRHEPAPAEQLLWRFLRDRQLGGHKFRRQAPLGAFIADFYCHAVKLVVELDGDTHVGREASDEVRTMLLSRSGYHVVRFYNTDVFDHLPPVLEAIYGECDRLSTPTPPTLTLSRRERGPESRHE
jgi:very-short-patch-repair endonuclease